MYIPTQILMLISINAIGCRHVSMKLSMYFEHCPKSRYNIFSMLSQDPDKHDSIEGVLVLRLIFI